MVKAPFMIPEDPIPDITRPMMRTIEEEDRPQMRQPSSKMKRNPRNIHYVWSAD